MTGGIENADIRKSSVSYVDGKNGEYKSWYKNKNLKSEGFYRDDLMDGIGNFIMIMEIYGRWFFLNGNERKK